MTDRELMQQALDALNCWPLDTEENSEKVDVTVDALRARLAQPEAEPYCWTWDKWISGGYWEAQYGWEPYRGEKRPQHVTDAKPLYTVPPRKEWCQCEDAPNDCTYEKNCRVPQIDAAFKRIEWQGLTDEEIIQATILIDNRQSGWILDLSRAIEAKLKEKNSASN